ncbi:MAG: hypothetical protein JST26_03325 [Bacteroidetes bacterium]|nr:hypothetical protein [Bacteroidota bacterium]
MRKAIGILLIIIGSVFGFLMIMTFVVSLPSIIMKAGEAHGTPYVIGYVLGFIVFFLPAVGLVFWGLFLLRKRKPKIEELLNRDLTP